MIATKIKYRLQIINAKINEFLIPIFLIKK